MKKNTYVGIIAIFLILLISVLIIEGLILAHGDKMPTSEQTEGIDYLIVLGARLYGDKPSPALLERLKSAQKYLEENNHVKVVVSGGQGKDELVSEAYAMRAYLINNGIEGVRVILEDKSTNTFENLKLSLDKIKEEHNIDNIKVLIATNKYHIFRAKLIAKRLGMIPYGLPSKIPPTIVLHSYIREYFAVWKSLFCDKV